MEDFRDIDFNNATIVEDLGGKISERGTIVYAGVRGATFRFAWRLGTGAPVQVDLNKESWMGVFRSDGIVRFERIGTNRMDIPHQPPREVVGYVIALDW